MKKFIIANRTVINEQLGGGDFKQLYVNGIKQKTVFLSKKSFPVDLEQIKKKYAASNFYKITDIEKNEITQDSNINNIFVVYLYTTQEEFDKDSSRPLLQLQPSIQPQPSLPLVNSSELLDTPMLDTSVASSSSSSSSSSNFVISLDIDSVDKRSNLDQKYIVDPNYTNITLVNTSLKPGECINAIFDSGNSSSTIINSKIAKILRDKNDGSCELVNASNKNITNYNNICNLLSNDYKLTLEKIRPSSQSTPKTARSKIVGFSELDATELEYSDNLQYAETSIQYLYNNIKKIQHRLDPKLYNSFLEPIGCILVAGVHSDTPIIMGMERFKLIFKIGGILHTFKITNVYVNNTDSNVDILFNLTTIMKLSVNNIFIGFNQTIIDIHTKINNYRQELDKLIKEIGYLNLFKKEGSNDTIDNKIRSLFAEFHQIKYEMESLTIKRYNAYQI